MRYTEHQCEFKAWPEIAWCLVAVCPTTKETIICIVLCLRASQGGIMQFKHSGIHPLWRHQTKCWHQIYSKEHLVSLMSLVKLVLTSPLSSIPLNTCSLKQICFTDRTCLPTKPTVPGASVPVLLQGGTIAKVTALCMQASLVNKHFLSWQQRLIKINMCLRDTFRNL